MKPCLGPINVGVSDMGGKCFHLVPNNRQEQRKFDMCRLNIFGDLTDFFVEPIILQTSILIVFRRFQWSNSRVLPSPS